MEWFLGIIATALAIGYLLKEATELINSFKSEDSVELSKRI